LIQPKRQSDVVARLTPQKLAVIILAVVITAGSIATLLVRVGISRRTICLVNQEQIYGAIVARALDGKYHVGDHVPIDEILPLIGGHLPECPSGGKYVIPAVGEHPVCSRHRDLLLSSGKLAGPGGMDAGLRKRPVQGSERKE
jgi:hypothetical protein